MDILPQKQCSNPDCKQWLPAMPEYFSRQKSSKDGFKSICKQCQSKYRAAYYTEHREQEKQRLAAYGEAHREELKQYSAQYRKEHPEEVRQSNARYNQEHREERLRAKAQYNAAHRQERIQYARQWHQEHKEEQALYNAQYNQQHREERLEQYRRYRTAHREESNRKTRLSRQTAQGRMKRLTHENNRRARKLSIPGTYTAQDVQVQYDRQKGKCYYCSSKFGKGKRAYHVDHIVPLTRNGSNDPSNLVLACPLCNLRKSNKLLHEWEDGGRLL